MLNVQWETKYSEQQWRKTIRAFSANQQVIHPVIFSGKEGRKENSTCKRGPHVNLITSESAKTVQKKRVFMIFLQKRLTQTDFSSKVSH